MKPLFPHNVRSMLFSRWMLGVFGLLLMALGGVSVFKHAHLGRIDDRLEAERQQVAEQAFSRIHRDFERTFNDVHRRALEVAESEAVIESLRRYTFTADPAGERELIALFSEIQIDDGESIELYTVAPRLIAWKGFSMPIGEAPASSSFPYDVRFEAIVDRGIWEALVSWHPVVYDNRVIGSVRAMQLVGVQMPVENQYLKSNSLSDSWRRLTQLPVSVGLGAGIEAPDLPEDRGIVRHLVDPSGETQGYVYIAYPSEEALRMAVTDRYTDLQTLLIAILFLGAIVLLMQGLPASFHVKDSDNAMQALVRNIVYFVLFALAWWGMRFGLLYLEVPARWQRGKAPLSPLFDPSHFASDFGWGLFRSIGDMFISALFMLLFSIWCFRFIHGLSTAWVRRTQNRNSRHNPSALWAALRVLLLAAASISLMVVLNHILGQLIFRSVIDSTLDYVNRSGLIPDRLVFFVFCTLNIFAVAVFVLNVSLAWFAVQQGRLYWPFVGPLYGLWASIGGLILLAGWLYGVTWQDPVYRAPALFVMVIVTACWMGSVFAARQPEKLPQWLHIRGVLLAILLLSVPLYGFLDRGMDAQLRSRMVEAANSFDSRQDPRVVFALEEILYDARDSGELAGSLGLPAGRERQEQVDELVGRLHRLSSLSSLVTHDVSIAVFDSSAARVSHFVQGDQDASEAFIDTAVRDEYLTLKSMFEESGTDSILVEILTGRFETERFQYGGIGPLVQSDTSGIVGWIVARAEPKALIHDESTLFPKVLLPQGVSQLQGNLSLAQFQGDVLVRSIGAEFGHYRMREDVYDQLRLQEELWNEEKRGDREYVTYYKRILVESSSVTSAPITSVTAVRTSKMNLFDHLYYLLRFIVAGICVGAPLYLIARLVWLKNGFWRRSRLRFKDRVLNAFLGVGVFAVGIVGMFGLRVITSENENAIESWIKAQLERVEEYLVLNAEFGELPSEVLSRMDVHELSEKVGLDLNVYEGMGLARTSRQQLVRDRLIDERLPSSAYYELFYQGSRHAFAPQKVGTFQYTAGYRVLPDRNGEPRYIISVPTLPEQERIEEERARTVAYLFGALLLLVIAVMLTASLLANALARPIGRLREGLEAVARGRFERPLPVDTRDEIGELVHTFNAMQEQLADSRRQLAQQERQLAWREMARQVAHEIKNPLTPMKLSVQHLRRAFAGVNGGKDPSGDGKSERFNHLFDRITSTLIEQVDALARIANEFSSFARMPKRLLEPLDLNGVLNEAVDLMQEQVHNEIQIDVSDEPLILLADKEELRRIYINLIKNAIEATSQKKNVRIKVSSSLEQGKHGHTKWAYSTVEDEGTGISRDVVDRIFEPNFSSKTSGTGLGLAIVKKSVEELNGEIGFQTEEHQGTTFWIRLPLIED